MARITARKLDDLAAQAERLVRSIDRIQGTIQPMLENPRAKYVQVCRLIRGAHHDLHRARQHGVHAASCARAGAPGDEAEKWTETTDLAEHLREARQKAVDAADKLYQAMLIVGG